MLVSTGYLLLCYYGSSQGKALHITIVRGLHHPLLVVYSHFDGVKEMKLCVPPSDAAALKCLVAAHAGKVAVERAPAGKGEVSALPFCFFTFHFFFCLLVCYRVYSSI